MKRNLKRSKETYYFPFVVHFWSMTQRLKPLLYGAHTELKKKLPTKGKKYSWKCQTFPSITVSAFIPFVLRHIIHGERSLTYDSWSTVEVWDECGVWSVQVEQEGVSQGKCQFSVMNEQQKFRPSPWEPTAPDTRSNSQHLLSFNGTHSHYSPPDKGRRPRIRLR